jgi:glycosyltransferase involved in cell wall biosynthesis
VSPLKTDVLFIDDGSTDNGPGIISEICLEAARYRSIRLKCNYGLSTALKAGIDACSTSLVGYMDSDLQTTAEDFLTFLPFFPAYDMVLGVRGQRRDSPIKMASSRIANAVRKRCLQDGIEDTGCPLKILKIEFAQRIPFFIGMHRFMPALVQMMGGNVKQIQVRHFPRYGGKAKYHLGNRLVAPFMDMLAVLWMKKRLCSYEIRSKES